MLAVLGVLVLFAFPGLSLAQGEPALVRVFDTVIFDNSREQLWSPCDVGFFGYSELAISLREEGFLVSESNMPVTYSLRVDPRGSVLVMGPAVGQKYTQKEINAVKEYVQNGGGLLILAEPDASGSKNFQNALSSEFGMNFLGETVGDVVHAVSGTAGQWIFAKSSYFDVDSVSLPIAVPLMLVSPAFPILSAGETSVPAAAIVGAATTRGRGRVACIGDSQFLINGGKREIGLECGRNRQFAIALFRWLAGREGTAQCRIVPEYTLITGRSVKMRVRVDGKTDLTAHIEGGRVTPEKVEDATGELVFTVDIDRDGYVELVGSDGTRKTIVLFASPTGGLGARLILDVRGYGPEISDPINGFVQFARLMRDKGYWVWGLEDGVIDVNRAYGVVVINPLRPEGLVYLGDLTRETLRWVFINDPYSTVSVHNPTGQWFRDNGFEDREVPIHRLTEKLEMTFLPYTVFEPDKSATVGRHHTFPALQFGTERCNSFRCAVVQAIGGTNFLAGSKTSWGLEAGLGLRPELSGTKPGQNDYPTQVPVAAISLSGTAMVIGDVQLFSDQHIVERGNWTLAMELADWIAGRELEIPGQESQRSR